MQPEAVAQPPVLAPKPLPNQSMDVVAPRPVMPAPANSSPTPVPVDQNQTSSLSPSPTSPASNKNPAVLPGNVKPVEASKQELVGSGSEIAIVATVVIILGLAAMAVYAYVRQMK
ncbi:hypothetical protein H7171_00460 [Candidatus Saccharibacteria bacterium]|nr:hypothetical protein [Candidatus Saccharibacteria bacterium]